MADRYRADIFGLRVESPFPLPAAVDCPEEGACDLAIAWCAGPVAGGAGGLPEIGYTPTGAIEILWANEIHVWICPAGARVRITARREKLPFLPTLTVGMIIGLVLLQRGILALHGTVLTSGGKTVAFLGPSGVGKSTIAAALAARGARLLADDIVALRQESGGVFRVASGPAGLRLTRASADAFVSARACDLPTVPWTDKLLWRPEGEAPELPRGGAPLDAIYIVSPDTEGGETAVCRVDGPARAVAALIENWYPPHARALLTGRQLQQIGALAGAVPVHALRYARRWDGLDAIHAEVSA